MTIRNLALFTNSLWDWGFLNACFDDGCKVSDLDGQVERRGQFLVIEAKGETAQIPTGQAKTFNRYLELGTHTPLIIYGDPGRYRNCCLYCGQPTSFEKEPPTPTRMQIWPHDPVPCDLATVQAFSRAWFRWANDQPVPLLSGCRRPTNALRGSVQWTEEWLKAMQACRIGLGKKR